MQSRGIASAGHGCLFDTRAQRQGSLFAMRHIVADTLCVAVSFTLHGCKAPRGLCRCLFGHALRSRFFTHALRSRFFHTQVPRGGGCAGARELVPRPDHQGGRPGRAPPGPQLLVAAQPKR